ncbi:MAG: multiheme c-type cytochrome, partial [bacterium]
MSPGFTGQFVSSLKSDSASVLSCLDCHAPLTEQAPVVIMADESGADTAANNPAYQAELLKEGIGCAACHLRAHQIFGPPQEEGGPAGQSGAPPHGGFTASDYFQSPEFCAVCHQHPADTAINSKPLENTYLEWLRSPYPREGKTCQTCHMPSGDHSWRGIHDMEQTQAAMTVRFKASLAKDSKKTVTGSLK